LLAIATLLPMATPATAASTDIVLVLDNSGSMKKNDPDFLTGLAVTEFLQGLQGDINLAVLIFDQRVNLAVPLSPLTDSSRGRFLDSLTQVDYQGQFTDSPAAIERAIYELRVNGRSGAEKFVVFMTDGIVDTGDAARDREKENWLRNDLAADAAEAGVRIFGIAFTEAADFLLIQSLAQKTGGEYYRAFSAADINGVFAGIKRAFEQASPLTPVPLPVPLPAPAPAAPLPSLPEATPGSGVELPALPPIEPGQEIPLPPPSDLIPLPEVSTPTESLPEIREPTTTQPTVDTAPEPTETEARPLPPAPTAPQLPPTTADTGPGMPILIGGGVGALLLVVVVIVLLRSGKNKTGAASPEQVPKAFLNDLGGNTDKTSHELNAGVTLIGRQAGDDPDHFNYVVVDNENLSRRHATIEYRDHGFWVIDHNSLNGTFVNNQRIRMPIELKHGDRVRFYKFDFEFIMQELLDSQMTMFSQTVFSEGKDEPEAPAPPPDDDESTTLNPGKNG